MDAQIYQAEDFFGEVIIEEDMKPNFILGSRSEWPWMVGWPMWESMEVREGRCGIAVHRSNPSEAENWSQREKTESEIGLATVKKISCLFSIRYCFSSLKFSG